MNDIEALRKALTKKHPCDPANAALKHVEDLVFAVARLSLGPQGYCSTPLQQIVEDAQDIVRSN